jgi:hypothetical protein
MIYSKLEGTTSKQFKLGKNGIQFQLKTDDPNVLEIATPNGGLFTIGLGDVVRLESGDEWYDPSTSTLYTYTNNAWVNTGVIPTAAPSSPVQGDKWYVDNKLYTYKDSTTTYRTVPVSEPSLVPENGIPTAFQIRDYVSREVEKLVGEDFEFLNEALNSISELVAAIGNDPDFFSNLVEILGTDYVNNGSLYMPTDIPDENNDGSGVSGKDGLLDASTVDKTASVSKRLSILEKQKSGQRLSVLSSFNQTTDENSLLSSKNIRDNHLLYVYEKNGNNVIQKKISLAELRKLRPGIYTGKNDKDAEKNDYFFEEITGGN